ncbi:serine-protein kinase RsbW [Marinobacter litoralis]|uniref:Serine-protein kinase RsbW n=1 Tax=Marinobacter litoralis TaxID=187981 RepID=A0A3M2RL39_9GAMM|nr:ATP-binding protein [Marinobacter litoralis]RMJ05625.1 serine-protein kinase RsbW [Marinobacter litoralis]
MKLQVRANEPVSNVLTAVAQEALLQGVADTLVHDLKVVVDEIHANLRMHVAADNPELNWTLVVEVGVECLELVVEYPGPYFDSTNTKPMSGDALGSRADGGMGLHLISALSDEFHYNYQDGINTMIVRWSLKRDSKENLLCR